MSNAHTMYIMDITEASSSESCTDYFGGPSFVRLISFTSLSHVRGVST